MSVAVFDIEREFAKLSAEAQIDLLERLLQHVRVAPANHEGTWDAEISAMAEDPAIQKELSLIKSEFSATEGDGLGRD